MTIRQTVLVKPDGTTIVRTTKPNPVRPTPQPCPDCDQIMSVVDEPMQHYACDTDGGCGITRDICIDTGLMTERPFDPTYIGDLEIELD